MAVALERTRKVGAPKLSLKNLVVFGIPCLIRIFRAPRFKKSYTVAPQPPWSRNRLHLAGMNEPMRKAVQNFAKAATETKGKALSDRMSIISALLKGKSYGGEKRPEPFKKMKFEELQREIERIRALLTA